MLTSYNYSNLNKVLASCRKNSLFTNVCVSDLPEVASSDKTPFLTIRCDVEYDPENAFLFAGLLEENNLTATFHFRIDTAYDESYMLKIQGMGHEVGFHNNSLDQAKGDFHQAKEIFRGAIQKFRTDRLELRSVSRHSELFLKSKHYKMNEDLFEKFPELLAENNVNEAYYIYDQVEKKTDVSYLGDNFYRVNHLLSNILEHPPENNLIIIFHPHRWRKKKYQTLFWVTKDLLRACGYGLKSPIKTTRTFFSRLAY